MDSIDPEHMYDERGEVARSRPILQGDVFADVVLPDFGDQPRLAQVVTHPCAMRRGASLHPRITVARVAAHALVGPKNWSGNLRVMPLAYLMDGEHFATHFADITAVRSDLLRLDQRIASLSNRGIYVLQQRLVKHYTRLEIPIPVLRNESACVLEEAEQQRDWIETILEEDVQTVENLDTETKAYDAWLSDGDPSRRELLKEDHTHTDIRRAAHQAAVQRRESLSG